MSDVEALCFDVCEVTIIEGTSQPIWRIHIKEQRPEYKSIYEDRRLEFKNKELLDDIAFREKYLATFHKSIYFTKREWTAFINVISEKAEIVDVANYSGYYGHALYVCAVLCDIKDDTGPEHPCCMIDKKDGYYYVPVKAVKAAVKNIQNLGIGIKIVKIVLEKLGVKTPGDCYIEICGEIEKVWQLSVAKIEQYGVPNWD